MVEMTTIDAESSQVCFALRGNARPAPERLKLLRRIVSSGPPRLPGKAGIALGRLVPALICGEESAVLVFHELRMDAENRRALGAELSRIESEERTHHAMLSWLRRHLPTPDDLAVTQARAKWFFDRMESPDLRTHLGRIVELDSAVCRLMHAAERSSALAAQPAVREVFARIRMDEARHVAMARKLRLALGWRADSEIDDRDYIQSCIARLLEPLSDAFESLGVDPDRVFGSFRTRVA